MRGWPIIGLVVIFFALHGTSFVSGPYDKAAFLAVTKCNRLRLANRDYFLLVRSRSTKQWSFFSAAPSHNDEDAADTAARAVEQALDGAQTMGLSYEQWRERLDVSSRKTWFVIDNQKTKRAITFISFIEKRNMKKIKKAFYRCGSAEFDRLAVVRWENIELMIRYKTNEVYAHLLLPRRSKEEYRPIIIAQVFIDAVAPFFLRTSFERGDDVRVRIYK